MWRRECRTTFWEFMNDSIVSDAVKLWSKMNELHPCVADVPVRAFLMLQGFSATFCVKSKFRA